VDLTVAYSNIRYHLLGQWSKFVDHKHLE